MANEIMHGYLKAVAQIEMEKRAKWVWRYMDIGKFISLLNRKSVFFSEASKFADSREGFAILPRQEKIINLLERYRESLSGAEIEKVEQKSLNADQVLLKKLLAISCWNRSEHESVALWNMYTHGNMGVAIRSNFEVLAEQFKSHRFKLVHKDVDYESLAITKKGIEAFFRKANEYKFESEYRFILDFTDDPYWNSNNETAPSYLVDLVGEGGVYLPIDLNLVIEEIRLHYKAPKWVHEDIVSLVKSFGLDEKKVKRSDLDDEG
ncbi:hypothetical protein [Bdellovibrio bacteriovorus]|uniref:hypothetical protein n=1 Tax=Bdellovibrio bacteriovorus TaxID=959 RepID=UPI003AA8A1FB